MLIGVVSGKGSPGATTAGLGIAARWPTGPGVLVEADPAGGDVAARFGLSQGSGLASMAVMARHSDPSPGLSPGPSTWTRMLPFGVAVVPAAPGTAAAAALSALAGHGRRLLAALAKEYPVVVVDGGRWAPGSPADELLSECDVVLLVARPVLDQVRQCEARVDGLRRLVGDVRLLAVQAAGGWPAAEVGAVLEVPTAGVLPADEQGAGVLAGRLVPRSGWRARGLSSWVRLPLPRACHSLARTLSPVTATVPAEPATPAIPGADTADSASQSGPRSSNTSTPPAGPADETPLRTLLRRAGRGQVE